MSIKSIDEKFKSSNGVPVTVASVTREEWQAVKARLAGLKDAIRIRDGGGHESYCSSFQDRCCSCGHDVAQEALRGGE